MKASKNGLQLIKSFEGLSLKAYKCPANIWTIGYGSTKGVKDGMVITLEEAEALLKADLKPVEDYLNKSGLILTQNKFDALASFIFNLGIGAFNGSTLKKTILNNGDESEIRYQFNRWVYAGKNKLTGLVIRRDLEADLFFSK